MNSGVLVAHLLSALNPSGVYKATAPVARVIMTTVTPSLYLLALYVRLLETQFDTVLGATGRLAQALRDIAVWGVVLVVYFAAGDLINHFLNALYRDMGRMGSLRSVAQQMAAILKVAAKGPSGAWGTLKEINALPLTLATVLLYYTTLVLTTFLEALLRITQAIGYEFAFLYGLIAIPISLSRTFSLLRGFAKLMGFFILWPIVQALLLSVFSPLFLKAVSDLQWMLGKADYMLIYAHMLFTILNLILCAVLCAAPYITASLIENAGAAHPLIEPHLRALSGFGNALSQGVGAVARRAAAPLLEEDEEITSAAPRPMPTLHIPKDPDYWPISADGNVPLTNYLDPQFDAPKKEDTDDKAKD